MNLADLLPPLIPVLGALIGALRIGAPDETRRNLRYDAEVAQLLPAESLAKEVMLEHLKREAEAFAEREKHARREVGTAVVALVVAAALTWLSMWLVSLYPLMWLLAAPLLLIAAICAFMSVDFVRRIPRDDTGNALKGSGSSSKR